MILPWQEHVACAETVAVQNLVMDDSLEGGLQRNFVQRQIRITENAKTVTGEIYEISPRADHRSETFEIKVLVDNHSHVFKAGMSGVLVKVGE